MMDFDTSLEFASTLDQQDELEEFRDAFVIDDADLIYMDGNSLGRLPKASQERLSAVIETEWGQNLINSWGGGWYDAPRRLGDKLGPLLGAGPGQVIVVDSTTINLFKLVMAALSARKGRSRIVSDTMNFPTDLYVLQNCIRLLGNEHTLHLIESRDGIHIDPEDVKQAITPETALVTFSTPTFKSGFLYDIEALTRAAHEAGALVLWDLSHCAGVVPLELNAWEVDFAVGCTYKYLNGGPGAPAYLYVRDEVMAGLDTALAGWWGHRSPFAFDLDFQAADGISRFLVGTPPVLSMMAIEPALAVIADAGVERIRAKSIQLTEYLINLYDAVLAPLGFELGSPRDSSQRGSHVSIRHPDGYRICQALIEEMKVIPDFREPDNIRLGLAPLYTSFSDVWQAVERIRQVVEQGAHLGYSAERQAVT
jgi:kynureninase